MIDGRMSENNSPKLGAILNEAQAIIASAETRAREILQKAEKAYQEAKEAGYQDGFQSGKQEAVTSAVRLLEESPMISEQLASEAAKLAVAISSFVVGRHVAVAPEAVKEIALRALQESVIGESARITVHPEDREVIDDSLEELRRAAGGSSIIIETDPTMTRGGCTVRTDFGEVDSSIEALIDAIALRLGVRI